VFWVSGGLALLARRYAVCDRPSTARPGMGEERRRCWFAGEIRPNRVSRPLVIFSSRRDGVSRRFIIGVYHRKLAIK